VYVSVTESFSLSFYLEEEEEEGDEMNDGLSKKQMRRGDEIDYP
jgi:hypothetical protein